MVGKVRRETHMEPGQESGEAAREFADERQRSGGSEGIT